MPNHSTISPTLQYVACLVDNSSGAPVQIAEITYVGRGCSTSNNLHIVECDLTGTVIAGPTSVASGFFISPRNEAMSQYDASASPYVSKYQIVVSQGLFPTGVPSMPNAYQVYGYGDVGGGGWLSTAFTPDDVKGSCVAAGINPNFSGDIGNQQYTTGFFPRTASDIYERSIDPFTGGVDSRWWAVNCSPANYNWDEARTMAVSNCSNSGLNLLTAWFDGANILYKESPNAMAFKTTGTTNVSTGKIAVYPNPVSDKMQINGAGGSVYRISDVTGKIILHGQLPLSGTVEAGQLQPGLYLLNLTNGREKSQTIKFTKL